MSAPAQDKRTATLYPLHIGEVEDGAAEVGRPETGVFVSLPEPGITLIEDMQRGLTLAEVSANFAQRYGEPPDLDDFLATLADCGFVRTAGDEGVEAEAVAQPVGPAGPQMRGWHLLSSVPAERVAWLVSGPALVVWAMVWVAVPVFMAVRPDLIPSGADGRLGLGVAADAVALTVLSWGLLLAHEAAHLLTVRARGCTGVLRISNRLHLLVAETDMSAVRSLPRRQRYAPYLAGMTFTMSALLLSLLAQLVGWEGQPIRAIGFLCLVTLLLELAFFMRTDVYYVIVTWLRLGNLMADTWQYVGNQLARLVRRPQPYDLSSVPARELRIVRWYSLFLVLGVAIFVGQFLMLGLPLLISFVQDATAKVAAGPSTAGFWDAVVLLLLAVAHFGTLGVVALRRRLRPVTRSR
ncbi:PqqD family protein [Micromonospora sp. NPDC004551]|uniref:PqqD family protein n=1 Tax=Micromonospora sp. NPDC004551 TaxID=3154284 RepID=UPI0033B40BA9